MQTDAKIVEIYTNKWTEEIVDSDFIQVWIYSRKDIQGKQIDTCIAGTLKNSGRNVS